jgi:hypothetical protein
LLGGNLALQYGAAHLPAAVTAVVMLSEVLFAALSSVGLGSETPGRTYARRRLLILAATLLTRPTAPGGGHSEAVGREGRNARQLLICAEPLIGFRACNLKDTDTQHEVS